MNKNKLLAVLREHGDTQSDLAFAIGLSRTRLSMKINSKDGAVFTQPEILAIKKRYNMDDTLLNAIFFEEYVS